MGIRWFVIVVSAVPFLLTAPAWAQDEMVDLSGAVVTAEWSSLSVVEATALRMLVEEIELRTGIVLRKAEGRVAGRARIDVGRLAEADRGELKAEGFRLDLETGGGPVMRIRGVDERGVLFGVGAFLRKMAWAPGRLGVSRGLSMASSPDYPIRGHQLGYRNRANSWDAWTPAQFEQYIRELVIFGTNAIENIPFEDASASSLMKLPRAEMNVKMSEICAAYGLDYWLWTPAEFDLSDQAQRAALLAKHEQLYKECPRLDAVFFPGGDPGNNHPRLVMEYLRDVSEILARYHPEAGVWLSLQGFNREEVDYVHAYLDREKPDWFTGLVSGPSSPPIASTRERLDERYGLRHYPDITHTIRCQYPTPQWDQAFALTLGREAINPEPARYRDVHNRYAPYTDGFITYSDGVHDDVNKVVWSMLGWDVSRDVETMLGDYARFFFGPALVDDAVKGIGLLEANWQGSLSENAQIPATYAFWKRLSDRAGTARATWRWQSLELRSVYDYYTRLRLGYERGQELAANEVLRYAAELGSSTATGLASMILGRADRESIDAKLRGRIEELCDDLYESIGLQTSTAKYGASGAERGCILDFVDYPLNNRWWLEDQFALVNRMPSEAARVARLVEIAEWENPPGCVVYDDIGNVSRSPNVGKRMVNTVSPDGRVRPDPDPSFVWWDNGMSRQRLSWQSYIDWPGSVAYSDLDSGRSYRVRMTGYGEALLRIDGERVEPLRYEKDYGGIKEFAVPASAYRDGEIRLTWDTPDERHLNWRNYSRANEVWLIAVE